MTKILGERTQDSSLSVKVENSAGNFFTQFTKD